MDEWQQRPVRELAEAIAAGTLTPAPVLQACLRKIDARERTLAAWAHVNRAAAPAIRGDALAAAPLCGIPIGVKDIIDTADMPTCYGSAIYEGFRPAADAACVALARAAGAVVLGKTVTAEFGLSSPGATRNPHNEAHTPGASSSGSAAAVAAGMVPLALGTQTGGSIIRPASYCGIVGYKPSFGLIDRTGVKPLAHSLDTIGVLTRTVDDAQYFAGVLARRELAMPLHGALRIGRYGAQHWGNLSAAAQSALQQADEALLLAGAVIGERPLPSWHDELQAAFSTIVLWDVAATLAFEKLQHLPRLREETRKVLGYDTPAPAEYDEALIQGETWRAALDALFGDCDVLLAPAVPDVAPEGILHSGDPSYCVPWSLLHTPSLAVPVTTGARGLPIGVQLIARIGDDARLLAVGRLLESTLQAMRASQDQAEPA
ncbi:amidase [Dyella acidiphila]|uniref:Amidase n=1 Tax=Dyella acidiphila TaxID=2775866 RepID=A0ABR9G9C2_9GAMM|nr:amidase [Dyella acidiphila]MBE1160653.1 amidase [Dyella acidiphila]